MTHPAYLDSEFPPDPWDNRETLTASERQLLRQEVDQRRRARTIHRPRTRTAPLPKLPGAKPPPPPTGLPPPDDQTLRARIAANCCTITGLPDGELDVHIDAIARTLERLDPHYRGLR